MARYFFIVGCTLAFSIPAAMVLAMLWRRTGPRQGEAGPFCASRHSALVSDHERLPSAHRTREPAHGSQGFPWPVCVLSRRDALKDLSDRADDLLDTVGLGSRRDRTASALAHGEQRALEIGMALAADPKLLLLDEPTAGMGPEETKDMVALLRRLGDERTILLVEHKMKMILGLSERVLVLHHGRLIADGTPAEIQADAEVKRVYLGQTGGYGHA